MIQKIAWRNIWRKKSRTAAILMAVVSGLTGSLFAIGSASSYKKQFIDSVIDYQSAHLVLQHSSFRENYDARHYMPDTDSIMKLLAEVSPVEAATARIRLDGYVSTAYNSSVANIYGVDPETEKAVFDLHKQIPDTAGGFFHCETVSPIVLGQALADRMEVGLSDRIISTFQAKSGNITSAAFRVAGIYSVDNKVLETSFVYVLKDELAMLSGYEVTESHEVAVRLTRGLRDIDQAQELISALIPGHHVVRWQEVRMDVAIYYYYVDILIAVIVGIVLSALCLGLINTMLMAVLERSQELGTLRIIGMSDRKVFYMIMLEMLSLVGVGMLLGIGVSSILMAWFGKVGIGFAHTPNSLFYTAYALNRVYPAIRPEQYVYMVLFVISTGVLASIFPTVKVLSKKPAEAVKQSV